MSKIKWLLLALIVGCGRGEAPAPATQSAPAPVPAALHKPLPDAAFKVRWGSVTMPPVVKAGSTTPVTVTITNASSETWPDAVMADPAVKDGRYAVRVSYRWTAGNGKGAHAGTRIDLPHAVGPGETITVPVNVEAPVNPGQYSLELELLQELVVWFEEKGVAPLKVAVEIR